MKTDDVTKDDTEDIMAYTLTRKALILDLHAAFQCAKRHKGTKPYVQHFERKLSQNIEKLADDLLSRNYQPEPSTVFIVERPKKREVFAAQFRDRVVHHLYFNYVHELFERTFVADTYSCIEGRGTHYGIERLRQHMCQESHNWQRDCYVMRLDKRGYFMHIDRQVLLGIVLHTLDRMSRHRIAKGHRLTWSEWIDIDFVKWLSREIIMLDPKKNCRIVGNVADWDGLDHSKSLFYTMDGCGLPIGNLTSQLLSNVYLNEFDQFMKRTLHCKHYGRYVDDSFVVSHDRDWLLSLVPSIREFLRDRLHLELHMGKLHVTKARQGAEFLGGYIKPHTTYISNQSLRRMKVSIDAMNLHNPQKTWASVCSFLGVLSHYDSYNIRSQLFLVPDILGIGTFNRSMTEFVCPLVNLSTHNAGLLDSNLTIGNHEHEQVFWKCG